MASPPDGSNSSESGDVVAGYVMPDQYDDLCAEVHKLSETFWLVPNLWAEYKGRDDLDWQHIKFDRDTITKSRGELVGRRGVYTLVIRSNVANHPHANYLVYVGQTKDQDFYTRWLQELRLPNQFPPKQNRLRGFLTRWGEHMWACFADLTESIGAMEDQLKKAWLPPANDSLPGILNQARPAFN